MCQKFFLGSMVKCHPFFREMKRGSTISGTKDLPDIFVRYALYEPGFSKFLGNPYPCHPVDLDAPVERNEEVVSQRAAEIGKSLHDLEKETQQLVYLGGTSDVVDVHVDVLWVALEMKPRSPQKFMDVSGIKVSDADGFCLAA